jgi:N-methylhydantoinase A
LRRVRFSTYEWLRYKGQGHEIEVPLPDRPLVEADVARLRSAYEERYRLLFQRSVPGMTIEIMNWGLTISSMPREIARLADPVRRRRRTADRYRRVRLASHEEPAEVPLYARSELAPGDWLNGPALIIEGQTTTVVGPSFDAVIDEGANIVMSRRSVADS